MARMDWQRAAERDRTRRGSEADAESLLASAPPRMRRSKAALRAEIDAAMQEWQAPVERVITCMRCGREATVTVAPEWRNRMLACSACGTRQPL